MQPSTIVIYADIACPWSHVAVHRLHKIRGELGLQEAIRFDHRVFPLELINRRPTPRRILDAEIPVAGALDPSAGWQLWQGPEAWWPVTTLLALEAVQAAKEQGLRASEELDRALRLAFFRDSRCISMMHVVIDVARQCSGVDTDALRRSLEEGRARRLLFEQFHAIEKVGVRGSPHLFFHDGSDAFNPGVQMHWEGEHGRGFPVVEKDDPSVYEQLLQRAAA
ncbi:MAG TPA: DsbA family protein [Candidatus Sulfotelmatobacter sp.]|nr:DsbA family protein [Candidatus Sulfotelmatobacter sp.]